MSNPYYNHSGYPTNSQDAQAGDVRAELLAIQAGFDICPALLGQGDKLVTVRSSETGLTSPGGKFLLGASWTPVLTCGVIGNLTIVYSTQSGIIHRVGQLIVLQFSIETSTFTYTTASGSILITGVPIISSNVAAFPGTLSFNGITKAGFTQFAPVIGTSSNTLTIDACGSAQTRVGLAITDLPTTGVVRLTGSLIYYGQS